MTYLDTDLCEARSLETHEGKRVCPDETFLFKIRGYIGFLVKTHTHKKKKFCCYLKEEITEENNTLLFHLKTIIWLMFDVHVYLICQPGLHCWDSAVCHTLYYLTKYEGLLPFLGYARQWHDGIVQ